MLTCFGKAHSLPKVSFEKRQHTLLYFENGVFVLYSHTGVASNDLFFILFNSHWPLTLIMCQAVI